MNPDKLLDIAMAPIMVMLTINNRIRRVRRFIRASPAERKRMLDELWMNNGD